MLILILIILLALVIMGPQYWASHVLKKYSTHRPDIPGTGGELVKHLRKKFSLDYLQLESTKEGDHYDPGAKTVRLSETNLQGQSLTAVAVAAHEFGHALQHARNYKPLDQRTRMVQLAQKTEKIGGIAIFALPLLAFTPMGARAAPMLIVLIILCMGINCIVHLVTLPVEFDASFGRALPILKKGQYIDAKDMRAVRKILTACALTYLASSLSGLLNFWRWFRFLKR
ncbi:MAG: zinc metallopeptidase [Pseudohongiellaceae bacterium]